MKHKTCTICIHNQDSFNHNLNNKREWGMERDVPKITITKMNHRSSTVHYKQFIQPRSRFLLYFNILVRFRQGQRRGGAGGIMKMEISSSPLTLWIAAALLSVACGLQRGAKCLLDRFGVEESPWCLKATFTRFNFGHHFRWITKGFVQTVKSRKMITEDERVIKVELVPTFVHFMYAHAWRC